MVQDIGTDFTCNIFYSVDTWIFSSLNKRTDLEKQSKIWFFLPRILQPRVQDYL